MNAKTSKGIAAILLIAMVAVLLTGCGSKKGVTIEGGTASIAESKCSMTLGSLTEVPYDTMREFMSEDQAETYADAQEDYTFCIVEFRHQGDHEFSNLAYQAGKGFAPSSNIVYALDNGREPTLLAANVGASRAYFAVPKENALASCAFTHEGYAFRYDFESGTWTYSDPNAPTPQPTERPEGAATDAPAVPVDEMPAEEPAGA